MKPCRVGGPQRFREGNNHKWPTCGPGGYTTPTAWGGPNTSQQGAESEVAHKWAGWLHNPYRLGGPQCFTARERIGSGPQEGRVATQPLPPRGSPTRHCGGQNQNGPTSGPGGYIIPSARGVPNASRQGAESELAHNWAGWLAWGGGGGTRHFTAGGKTRSGPQGPGGYITPAA